MLRRVPVGDARRHARHEHRRGHRALGSQIPTKLKGFFDQAVNHAGEFVSNMAAKGLQAGSDFLLNIAATLSQMPGRVAGWFSEIIFNAAASSARSERRRAQPVRAS